MVAERSRVKAFEASVATNMLGMVVVSGDLCLFAGEKSQMIDSNRNVSLVVWGNNEKSLPFLYHVASFQFVCIKRNKKSVLLMKKQTKNDDKPLKRQSRRLVCSLCGCDPALLIHRSQFRKVQIKLIITTFV